MTLQVHLHCTFHRVLLKLDFGSGTQCLLAHKVSVFRVEEMDLDDSREIRVNSGQVIGLIIPLKTKSSR